MVIIIVFIRMTSGITILMLQTYNQYKKPTNFTTHIQLQLPVQESNEQSIIFFFLVSKTVYPQHSVHEV